MTNQRAIILLSQMYLPAFDEEEKDAITKAIEALTAQEPRLLTLEEIRAWERPDIWCEEKEANFIGEYVTAMGCFEFALMSSVVIGDKKHSDGTPVTREDFYGKTWRCWTSRPTDEQREKEPWNG